MAASIAFSSSLVLRPVRTTRSTPTHVARSAARADGRAVVYAFGDDVDAPEASTSSTEAKVFYTDNNGKRVSGTETEYAAALASSQVYKASSITGVALGTETSGDAYDTVSLGDAMAFKGPGPELINGRCAMVAFLAAMSAELKTDIPVAQQLACEPTLVAVLAVLVAAGSLVTITKNVEVTNMGSVFGFVFDPKREMFNGRAAMLGFASLLVMEGITGEAFF